MTSTLEAAEALLATVEAARGRLLSIGHQHLPFAQSVALQVEGRVGHSPERAVLGMSHASLDLVRVAAAVAHGRIERPPEPAPAAAPAPAAVVEPAPPVEEALDPDDFAGLDEAPLLEPAADDEATQVVGASPELAAALAAEREQTDPGLQEASDITLDDLLRDRLPEPEVNPFVAAPDDPDGARPPEADVFEHDADDEVTLMDVASPLARPVPDPSAEPDPVGAFDAAESAEAAEDSPPPEEEETTVVSQDDEVGPTTVAQRSPELLAAIASPRAVTPSLGRPTDDFDDDRRYDSPPELVEHDGLAEPSTVAAIQLHADGRATPLSPTLELGDAEAEAAVEDDLHLPEPDADDFQLGFVEPEEDEEEEEDIPQLTAGAASIDEDSPVVVTRDGVQHRDGAAVADADVAQSDLDRLLAEAHAAERRGNITQAILLYGDLLSLQPSNVVAHLGRGRLLVEKGDYAAAMSDFQRSEDLAPEDPEPIVEMGNLFFARKEYRKAITYFDQAIEQAPAHAMAWCRRGICYYYRKNHQKAFQDLQKASSLDAEIPNLRKYVQMARNAMERARR